MGHLVDAHRHCQDKHIVLAGLDGDALAIARAEPLLGYFHHLIAPFTDEIFVI
jgi:hypothetical protein